ncbi:DciA family protein [Parvibaculum sp.]|uniref:DUF721 domain-containing protein n=1 Tax=Parvibaculum sp. TaxID=2024848 RepID=UPI001AFF6444|nr:DciA family protein [Parvibaculum sp.]MBO6634274.1 DUF721 domain-containing protein [Parvibaculum sp.]MBO6678423.1 DUF721 domain-containing protein [Parvibaculum sp.]MBO6684033.1 DUF721 domain-containing protein [Parvibaculum sp.]MBO6905787.1 DUF721 domain-containing protein [Parvibaculum sp.]
MTGYGRPVASMRYRPPPIGARVLAAAQSAFAKRGFREAHVLAHWPEIVGGGLAEFSSPEKLVFPRGSGDTGGKGQRSGATLTVRVDGPIAVEIRHLEPQIVERINSYYGYSAVARLKLVQGPLPAKPRPRYRKIRALSTGERAALAQDLEKIEEPALKQALEKLGERIIGARGQD